jgi:hypothetical protein
MRGSAAPSYDAGDRFNLSSPLTEREEDAQLRLDFAAFAQRCFRELNPLTALAMNWHVEVIAAKLAAVHQGRIRRLIVNVPPRYLKSLLASVAFPAWCLGRQPGTQILCVTRGFKKATVRRERSPGARISPTSSPAIAAASS